MQNELELDAGACRVDVVLVIHMSAVLHPSDWRPVAKLVGDAGVKMCHHWDDETLMDVALSRDQVIPDAFIFSAPCVFENRDRAEEVRARIDQYAGQLRGVCVGQAMIVGLDALLGDLDEHIERCALTGALRDFDIKKRREHLKQCIGFSAEANAMRGYLRAMDSMRIANPMRYRAVLQHQFAAENATEFLRMVGDPEEVDAPAM
jgi:hypothetical protein